MSEPIVLIVEERIPGRKSEYRVKILESFEPFNWLHSHWRTILPAYNARLRRMFADADPFEEFAIAIAYADDISFEYAERTDAFPELEIITISDKIHGG